ncbi:MAG: hypothetical protein DCC71_03690 [Proteobacteria bacterium]|nr:MAG: hypothetical protein DCC71_03690 [Pseudomonadota bacterium]
MKDHSDEALMAAYGAGAAAAFEELFRRHERRAWAFFRRRVNSEDRASDLYQELFLRLHRSRATYDLSRPFLPWFYQVARSVLIDDMRRAFYARELPLENEVATAPESDIERRLVARETVSQQLGHLTEEGARVIIATKLLGKGYDEVAREIGKSSNAIKQSASRSLRRLRVLRSSGG